MVVGRSDALHARPAALVVRTVAAHDAEVHVACADDRASEADGRSITALLALGVRRGDRVRVRATGRDAAAVLDAIRAILEDDRSSLGGAP